MQYKKSILQFVVVVCCIIIISQNCTDNPTSIIDINNNNPNSISGIIVDSSNSLPIFNVMIKIIGTEKTVFSDSNGYFSINHIPEGNFQLTFTKNNYSTDTLNVNVTKTDSLYLNVKLSIINPFLEIEGNVYKISFSRSNSIAWDIGIINSNGSGFKKLTENLNIYELASWSPDGSSFSFCENNDVYIMDSSGGSVQNITNDQYLEQSVSWSPDGSKLVFVSDEGGSYDIYTINKDGTNRQQLTHNSSYLETSYLPRWSPKDDYIAFIHLKDTKCEVHVIKPNGTDNHALTSDSVLKFIVKWSPSGDRLLINSREDDESEIYILSLNGNPPLRLTNNNWEDEATDWSNDGNKILFSSEKDGQDDIFIMNSDGSNPKNLTRAINSAELWGKFSPDGLKIAFWSNRNVDGEIYLMNLSGTRQIRLTYNPGPDQWPNWCPVPITLN